MTGFFSILVFITIQLFGALGHFYWKPFSDPIYFSSLLLCEVAVIIHGFITLIFTSKEFKYFNIYVIGYLFHVAILLIFSSLLITKYFTLYH
jgi:hypothetical protein